MGTANTAIITDRIRHKTCKTLCSRAIITKVSPMANIMYTTQMLKILIIFFIFESLWHYKLLLQKGVRIEILQIRTFKLLLKIGLICQYKKKETNISKKIY